MSAAFKGFIAPPPTPMGADGSVKLEVIEAQAAALAANGIVGAFVCGTTGEGVSLTVAERMQVAGRWREAASGDFRILVHVGCLAAGDAKALAEHAQAIRADGVATLPPLYFRPAGAGELVDWCAEIASAAPLTPFYYYHIPALTGVRLPMVEFLAAAAERIPNLAGVKFTHEDLMDFTLCLRLQEGRFDMRFGRDEIFLSALAVGARGAIGTTYNFAAPLYQRIVEAYLAGDMPAAGQDQARAAEMIAVLGRYGGGPRAAKAVMRMIGLDCGPVRPPLRQITDAEYDAFGAELEGIGFFDYCCRRG